MNERELLIKIEGMEADIETLNNRIKQLTAAAPTEEQDSSPPEWLTNFWEDLNILCAVHDITVNCEGSEAFVVRQAYDPNVVASFIQNGEDGWLVFEEECKWQK